MNDKPTPCPRCGGYADHATECTLQTVEQKAAMMMTYYEMYRKKCDAYHAFQIKWQQWGVMWQGKHAILRHENNKLRRALYRQEIKKKKDFIRPEP